MIKVCTIPEGYLATINDLAGNDRGIVPTFRV
jgi:hypothetical protein